MFFRKASPRQKEGVTRIRRSKTINVTGQPPPSRLHARSSLNAQGPDSRNGVLSPDKGCSRKFLTSLPGRSTRQTASTRVHSLSTRSREPFRTSLDLTDTYGTPGDMSIFFSRRGLVVSAPSHAPCAMRSASEREESRDAIEQYIDQDKERGALPSLHDEAHALHAPLSSCGRARVTD